ncbi:MAG: MFS transporter, partial [Deltaproteobacteria bacterium]|nr:MFS transporter [Deltaproteobacteria bacterium]
MTQSKFKKWQILAMFSLAAGLSQFLWLNFAPLISFIEKQYAVSEDTAGLLLLVFPLIYVLLSVPSGMLIDRRGYRFGIGLGLTLMTSFACLRIYTASFWVLLTAQIGIAIGQPFVVNGISKLVLDWFEPNEEAIATGIGTMGLLGGMAAGLAVSSPLVEAYGLRTTMMIFAGASALIALGFFVLVHPNATRAGKTGDSAATAGLREHLRSFLADRDLILIFILAFLGLGFFNGLTTWLEPILAPHGIDSVKAGMVG